jgi:hypothetical protein
MPTGKADTDLSRTPAVSLYDVLIGSINTLFRKFHLY